MLPKIHRLTKNKDFERVYKKGSGAKRDFLFLRWIKNELGASRFGFVVSNKISKKSTVRHRIRRRLGEAVGLRMATIKPGYDCVFMVTPGIKDKKYGEIESVLGALLNKAGLLI